MHTEIWAEKVIRQTLLVEVERVELMAVEMGLKAAETVAVQGVGRMAEALGVGLYRTEEDLYFF